MALVVVLKESFGAVKIGDDIEIVITEIDGKQAHLSIRAPKELRIIRIDKQIEKKRYKRRGFDNG